MCAGRSADSTTPPRQAQRSQVPLAASSWSCNMQTPQSADSSAETRRENRIRSAPRPQCALCGSGGESLHRGLRDRLFGATGSWDLKRCPKPDCGLVWLDPMPLPEDIGKAYANYYTHASSDSGTGGVLKRTYHLLRRGYLANRFGYPEPSLSFPVRVLANLFYLLPLRRSRLDASVRCLNHVPQGRLLDVGCGSGDWLLSMRQLGWQVDGLDFDAQAVAVARQRGLDVRTGTLSDQNYPSASFDAVTLNHVIEHVPAPLQTLEECARILKPGGKLVLFTPNVSSLSHRVFQSDWRGLEPPRHLHIFSVAAMRHALQRVGFQTVTVRSQIAFSVIYESLLLRRGQTGVFPPTRQFWSAWALAHVFNLVELALVNPVFADCFGVIAEKAGGPAPRRGEAGTAGH